MFFFKNRRMNMSHISNCNCSAHSKKLNDKKNIIEREKQYFDSIFAEILRKQTTKYDKEIRG